jgi:IMP dehydrogenase
MLIPPEGSYTQMAPRSTVRKHFLGGLPMNIRPDLGLTFDDVLLVPKHSNIRSRKDVSTATRLTPDISLNIPVISANMDTVTESHMAILMAQQGGIGFLHRFMSIEKQAESVHRVKRAESFVVENPLRVSPQVTIDEARQRMADEEVGGLIVVDPDDILLGIVTTRDVLLALDGKTPISSVMTPKERMVVVRQGETLGENRQKLFEHRIEKLPIVDNAGRVIGLITAQDIIKTQQHPNATKDSQGRLMVGVAIGVRNEDIDRAAACIAAGADVILIDIAHGHSEQSINMIATLKKRFSLPIVAGNVATPQGVHDLVKAGADAIKVGVGSGSICITRIVTGFGVPQLTSIAECAEEGHKLGVPIIADGGIRNSGDLTKALAAGASSVMIGNMLAGTEESPGASVVREGRRFKIVRGMASLSANVERRRMDNGEMSSEDWVDVIPEGIEAVVPYRGSAADILHQFVGGLRSGLSYAGAHNIEELWDLAEFIRITPAGKQESGAHDVSVI